MSKHPQSARVALDLLILTVLDRRGPSHGYDLASLLHDWSAEAIQVEEGSLYPALHRMEETGWISAIWTITVGRRHCDLMSWLSRLRHALTPERLDQDLADERRDHLERRAQDLISRGATPSEARSKARRAFGNVTRIHEESRAIKSATAVESTWQDSRYAWRGLRRRPIFALTSVLSISLAAGTTTANVQRQLSCVSRPPATRPNVKPAAAAAA